MNYEKLEVDVKLATNLKPMFFRIVILPASQRGGTHSIPASISTTVPQIPVRESGPKEFPTVPTTGAGIHLKPMEPGNNSILAIEYPLELKAERPGASQPL